MIEMDVNEWVEGLLEEQKHTQLGWAKPGDMAMPIAVGWIITNHSEMIEPELRPSILRASETRLQSGLSGPPSDRSCNQRVKSRSVECSVFRP